MARPPLAYGPVADDPGCVKLIHRRNVENIDLQQGIEHRTRSIIRLHDAQFLRDVSTCAEADPLSIFHNLPFREIAGPSRNSDFMSRRPRGQPTRLYGISGSGILLRTG